MKKNFNHPALHARRKQYAFACRDDATGALKPTPRNGSREKFCRRCPALRIHHKCLFGNAKAFALLKLYRIVEEKHAALITNFCTRCKKRPADNDFEYCTLCRDSLAKYGTRRVPRARCAFAGGCEQMIVVRGNKSGMCPKHAQTFRRVNEARRVNRTFTTGQGASA